MGRFPIPRRGQVTFDPAGLEIDPCGFVSDIFEREFVKADSIVFFVAEIITGAEGAHGKRNPIGKSGRQDKDEEKCSSQWPEYPPEYFFSGHFSIFRPPLFHYTAEAKKLTREKGKALKPSI